jgi:hypothetical protein
MQLRASSTILMDVAKLPHQTAEIHPGIFQAGVVTIEAVDELVSTFALIKECLRYKLTLGEYPKCYKGLQKCNLRALYAVFPKATKLAHSKKINTIRCQRYKNAFNCLKVPLEEKCFVCMERIGIP